MENIKVEGIVIKDIAYGETSKILTILTRDYGLLSVMSKGCRSIKSKLRGVSLKMTYGTFYLVYKPNGLSILKTVDIINPFIHILNDIEKISYVSYLLDLTSQLLKDTSSTEIFDLLRVALLKIEAGLPANITTIIIELKYLEFLGVAPIISGCVICGNTKNIETVSIEQGGYLCSDCTKNEKRYSEKFIQLLRMFLLVDLNKVQKLEINEEMVKEFSSFTELYYEKYTGLYMSSKQFLKNLKRIGC